MSTEKEQEEKERDIKNAVRTAIMEFVEDIANDRIQSHQERMFVRAIQGRKPYLPFPTEEMQTNDGRIIEVYSIPVDAKQDVLNQLWHLDNQPSLDEVMYDIHADQKFVMRDFMVTRECGTNMLCCPDYLKTGGTILDMFKYAEYVHNQKQNGFAVLCGIRNKEE